MVQKWQEGAQVAISFRGRCNAKSSLFVAASVFIAFLLTGKLFYYKVKSTNGGENENSTSNIRQNQ
jgi:hypothetical protein